MSYLDSSDSEPLEVAPKAGARRRPPRVPAVPLHVVGKPKRTRLAATPRRPRAESFVHRFLITLHETAPLVWRRIEVPESYSFWDLHVAIQDAMGWKDCHLHAFAVVHPKWSRLVRIGLPDGELIGENHCLAGWKVAVTEYASLYTPPMLYTYDFGDDWRHSVVYEGTQVADPDKQYPRCIGGARNCLPEDCGGPHGFMQFLAAIADRKHPEHDAMLQWAGGCYDPGVFDPANVRFDDPNKRWAIAFGDATEDK